MGESGGETPLWPSNHGADPAPPLTPGQLLEPPKYAALQKLDDPNEICAYEAIPSPRVPQAENVREAVGLPGAKGALQPGWGWLTGSGRVPRPTTPPDCQVTRVVWDVALTPMTLSVPVPRPRPASSC